MKSWKKIPLMSPVTTAKNRFSQVVNEAIETGPQWVTRHGKAAAVVLSADDYEALRPDSDSAWLQWLRSCPGDELADALEEREQEEVGRLSLD